MGGYGIGRSFMQTTLEDAAGLDIRWLRKNDCLIEGKIGTLTWSCGTGAYKRETASINYQTTSAGIKLNYRHRARGQDEYEAVEQFIYFEETPCHFGGVRRWFSCPRCAARVTTLYLLQKYFYCRHCHRLPYRSTLQSRTDRLFDRKHAQGRKIFEDYENGRGYTKRKGMHWKTFWRELEKYKILEHAVGVHSMELIEKLKNLE